MRANHDLIASQPNVDAYDVDAMFNDGDLAACCRVIHQLNVNAGWWTDLETGERITERNPYEIAELLHSELSEGFEGWRKNLKDNHLPQYDMLAVELVDTFVRACDYLGGEAQQEIERSYIAPLKLISEGSPLKGNEPVPECLSFLRDMVNDYSVAYLTADVPITGHIKARMIGGLALAVYDLTVKKGYPFMEILAAKLAYNINRADHKVENRRQEGGKKV